MAGVMGWPVMHSRSPLMHNYWMEQQGLAGTYVFLAIKPGELAPALRALHPLGFSGCNLTIPHKLDAMTFVDEVDEVARKSGRSAVWWCGTMDRCSARITTGWGLSAI